LVVALLSAVRFRHRMPSCDHLRSRCRPLSPINCLPPPPPPPLPLHGCAYQHTHLFLTWWGMSVIWRV
jgi:hypothetical protein